MIETGAGKKHYGRYWCKCPVCKGECGTWVDIRSAKYGWVCSDCRAGRHVLDVPKVEAKRILDAYLKKAKKELKALYRKYGL